MLPEAAEQLGAQQPTRRNSASDSRLRLQHSDGGGEAAPGECACERGHEVAACVVAGAAASCSPEPEPEPDPNPDPNLDPEPGPGPSQALLELQAREEQGMRAEHAQLGEYVAQLELSVAVRAVAAG